ncbi:ureidoacrylate amidohydrolase RutB isoform X2 [Folsomia candida]|uniref:Peroxyureidoacrylate/ureidoacrylate amidohydrolase RutB n=2 Tax=Folsomia candida TaxID=158441 RepID=A0A226DE58_FOLCA|nr:ureidoacrylate amidohydrolase RutB isoform X2 [Folsomia candida]OXA42871.1 Peroxyureidoacrylate/ureidoacrylate amidohydrolase RutB [Folsomia candida]
MGTRRLGHGTNYHWTEDAELVDLSLPQELTPIPVTIRTELKSVKVNVHETALVVIDMQNDFCEKGGWLDSLGLDWEKDRAPIPPLKRLIPDLRRKGVKIIWVNWGNRKDLANMYPNQMWTSYNVGNGSGLGYGDLNKQGSPILEKASWGSEVVEGLKVEQNQEDILVDKHRFSGFWDTPLDSILKNFGIRNILFAGVNTDQCVLHTLADANFLGYGCIMVKDCVATTSPDYCADATFYNVKGSFGFLTNSDWVIEAFNKVE